MGGEILVACKRGCPLPHGLVIYRGHIAIEDDGLFFSWTYYHQPCSCLCEMDPEWTVEGQATKEVEPRLP